MSYTDAAYEREELPGSFGVELSRGAMLGAQAAMQPPELARAIDEVHQLRHSVEELRSTLTDFTDRMLVGPPCEATNAKAPERPRLAHNGGVTGQLRRAIEDAADAASDCLSLATRLRQIG